MLEFVYMTKPKFLIFQDHLRFEMLQLSFLFGP